MVQREKYVIMPNHIHFIFRIEWELCGPGNPAPTISTVMAWFKYQATKEINALDGISGRRVFQRSFHDHIIRNRAEYEKIWLYIDQNPLTWEQDCFYPDEIT
ncbi:MAG TPA: transposase [Candidatus Merdivicinus intestinavium]|nr:transposase [Candidatus Merdivicinus intestinavium]